MYEDESYLMCRLCLNNCGSYIDIFNPKGSNGLLVWKILKELLQIEVSIEDGLPVTICDDCLTKLTDFKYFKTMCINSRIEFLKAMVNKGLVGSDSELPTPRLRAVPHYKQPTYPEDIIEIPEDRDPLEFIVDLKSSSLSGEDEEEGRHTVQTWKGMPSSFASKGVRDSSSRSIGGAVGGNARVDPAQGLEDNDCVVVVKEENGGERRSYSCQHAGCGREFCTQKGFRIHIHRWHKQGEVAEWKCPHCPFTVGGRKLLVAHVRMVHKVEAAAGGQPHRVKTAGEDGLRGAKTFKLDEKADGKLLDCRVELINLEANVGVSKGTKSPSAKGGPRGSMEKGVVCKMDAKLICSQCIVGFQKKRNYERHMTKVHSGVKVYGCRACFKFYRTPVLLQKHSLMHKENNEMSYWCCRCRRNFRTSKDIQRHCREAYKATKPVVCEVCWAGFCSMKSIAQHHCWLFGNVFTCPTCRKAFRNRVNCVKHLATCKRKQGMCQSAKQ